MPGLLYLLLGLVERERDGLRESDPVSKLPVSVYEMKQTPVSAGLILNCLVIMCLTL